MPILWLKNGHIRAGGIEGENFRSFLLTCLSYSTAFSLTEMLWDDYEMVPNAVCRGLEPYAKMTFEPRTRFGYGDYWSPKVRQTAYRATPASIEILSRYYQDIFLQKTGKVPKTHPDTVGYKPKRVTRSEDLCFWYRKTLVLGTVSHEFLCGTNEISADFARELMQFGDWEILDRPICSMDRITLQ